jgi:hypothetical protein
VLLFAVLLVKVLFEEEDKTIPYRLLLFAVLLVKVLLFDKEDKTIP